MKLQYGSFTHEINDAALTIQRAPGFSERGFRTGTREIWQVQGVLHGDTVAAVTTAIAALQTAYQTQGQTIKLLEDAGTETTHKIEASDALGGVRVTLAPSYPKGDGAEYTTYRSYTLTAEAIRKDNEVELLAFRETIQHTGTAGPRDIWIHTLIDPPVHQTVNLFTTQQIIQAGSAVGYSAYPFAYANPILPSLEHLDRRQIVPQGPQSHRGTSFTEFRLDWTFFFETNVGTLLLPNAF